MLTILKQNYLNYEHKPFGLKSDDDEVGFSEFSGFVSLLFFFFRKHRFVCPRQCSVQCVFLCVLCLFISLLLSDE